MSELNKVSIYMINNKSSGYQVLILNCLAIFKFHNCSTVSTSFTSGVMVALAVFPDDTCKMCQSQLVSRCKPVDVLAVLVEVICINRGVPQEQINIVENQLIIYSFKV